MAQPKAVRITCSECNSFYASESELWEHMQEVHRRSISERSYFQHEATRTENQMNRFAASREEWANLTVHLRNHVQTRFKSEELDAIDRFILLASQGSVFDNVYR
jgi:hypothetical protein